VYTEGRIKGKKNIKKVGNKLVNQNGVKFTQAEKKNLERLVNASMAKRKTMMRNEALMPRFVAGKDTGNTRGQVNAMGKESDFILAKKSKSLNKFESKEEYRNYIKNLERIMAKDYVAKRVEQYRKNDKKAILNVFGKDGRDIIRTLDKLTDKQYMEAVQKDETLEIGHKYSPESRDAKLAQMRDALNVFKNAPKGPSEYEARMERIRQAVKKGK